MTIKDDAPLADVIAELDRTIPRLLQERAIPGLSLALIRQGECAWAGGYGVKNAATREPVTPDTIFPAASCSKPVAAYAALKLCEAGRLDLDRPLAEYLPEPFLPDEPRAWAVTLRMALAHTSGLSHSHQPRLAADPGAAFSYSAGGLVYMQRAMEEVTGTPFGRYMDQRLLAPLGMGDSSFVWAERYEAQGAREHDQEGVAKDHNRPSHGNPAGTLLTHPTDYCKFLRAILRPPESDRQRLGRQSVARMLRPQTQLTGPLSWGLGWGLERGVAGDWFWHWGGGMVRNLVMASPERQSGVVIMTNSILGAGVWEPVVAIALGGEDRSGVAGAGLARAHPVLARLRGVDMDYLRSLRALHRQCAGFLETTLAAVTQRPVEIGIPYTDNFPNLEYVFLLDEDHAHHYVFALGASGGRATLTLYASTALALLGAADIEPRPLDPGEEDRLAPIVDLIMADLAKVWRMRQAAVGAVSPLAALASVAVGTPDLVNATVPLALKIGGVDEGALNRRRDAPAGHALCFTYQAAALADCRLAD